MGIAPLTAALALVGAVGLLNLVFTLGVVRRLREHERELERLARGDLPGPQRVMLPAGSAVGDFAATATDGTPVSRADLTAAMLVGFFSTRCGPCRELVPAFAERAGGWPGGAGHVLAVVVGGDEEAAAFVATLAPVARVVVEAEDGPLAAAFQVRGFPAYGVVDGGGTVIFSGFSLEGLAVGAAV